MKVHLVGLMPDRSSALARRFAGRGDAVSRSGPVPLDADLYILGAGAGAVRSLTRGLVVLDLLDGPGPEAVAWLPYADLCLVSDADARTRLVDACGCEPERIFVVTDDGSLLDLVDRAWAGTLPPAEVEREEKPMVDLQSEPSPAPLPLAGQIAALAARLEAVGGRTDVVLRGYEVRSRIPLLGPLVAWVRRNLTSHLREPYLDPILERQVALNRDLVALLREVLSLQAGLEARLARLEGECDDE